MKVLIAHNFYQQRGGEDAVFESEATMLAKAGHDVHRLTVRNDHIQGKLAKIKAALSVTHNAASVALMERALNDFKPDVVHIHNMFPTLSPAVIDCATRRRVPVLMTLHNYRPLCANAMLLRDGKVCEACLGGSRWPGVINRCYRGSRIGSACVGQIGPYLKRLIARAPHALTLIALTEFAKSRYVKDGFPADIVAVKGNGMADPGAGATERAATILYVGRLSPEKGVETLIDAARDWKDGRTLTIVGDGPDRARLEALAGPAVRFLGALPPSEVLVHMKRARALAVPSRWYEGFPMVVLEAMATGTPVLASRIGSLAEIVQNGDTGTLLDPFDVAAWQSAMTAMLDDPATASAHGRAARARFLSAYADTVQTDALLALYRAAQVKMERTA